MNVVPGNNAPRRAGMGTATLAAKDIRIQVNRVLRKAAADNLVVVNPQAGQVRVVRVVLLGAPSARVVFGRVVAGEVVVVALERLRIDPMKVPT